TAARSEPPAAVAGVLQDGEQPPLELGLGADDSVVLQHKRDAAAEAHLAGPLERNDGFLAGRVVAEKRERRAGRDCSTCEEGNVGDDVVDTEMEPAAADAGNPGRDRAVEVDAEVERAPHPDDR